MAKILLVFFTFLLGLSSVFADSSNATLIPSTENSDANAKALAQKFSEGTLQLYDIPYYLQYLTDLLIWLAGLLAVIAIMLAGYMYISGSFADKTDSAKTTITNVVKGLAVVISAWMVLDIIVRLITE